MKIFDSNLIIYSSLDEYQQLRSLIMANDVFISAVTKIETLGYHQLPDEDKTYFEGFFLQANVLPITDEIVDKATELRQQRKMSVDDCIIAATAVLNGFALYTNNTKDFIHIPGLTLTVLNPLNER